VEDKDVAKLRRGVIRLARRLRAERPADALSANKIGVLAHLHHAGPSTPGDIAAAEHHQPQSLTRIFHELEQAGLISRERSSLDRRQSVLAITQDGEAALIRDMAERDAWLRSALTGLTRTERQVLAIAGPILDRLAAEL
jgi:DNA-binding MarR family transcriptional regulator